MTTSAQGPDRYIAWRSVFGVAALQMAIALGWAAYARSQPGVLAHYDLAGLGVVLVLAQGLLAAVIEPLVGGLSDSRIARAQSRFGLIVAGALLTGLLFLSVATVQKIPILVEKPYLLLGLMIAWVAAMNTFRSPSLSLLRSAASQAQLPRAGMVLFVVGALVRAAGPELGLLIDAVGLPLTFAAGGLVLGAATLCLTLLVPSDGPSGGPADGASKRPPAASGAPAATTQPALGPLPARIGFVFLVGAGVALIESALYRTVPSQLTRSLHIGEPAATSELLLSASLVAIFLVGTVCRVGARRVLGLGCALMVAATILAAWVPLVPAMVMAIALGFLDGCAVPFALGVAPVGRGGTTVGLFFGGLSLSFGVVGALPAHPPIVAAVAGALMVWAGFAATRWSSVATAPGAAQTSA